VAYIAIGATMVGSILWTAAVGQAVKKGDELGYFAFGGSTLVTLLEKGRICWDEDLVQNRCGAGLK
jgi:phosphatidylserine decarboxylase